MKSLIVVALLASAAAALPLASAATGTSTAPIKVALEPVNGYHDSGVALLTPTKNGFTVQLSVPHGPAVNGGNAHIHNLTCARYGRIAPHPHQPTSTQVNKQLATVSVWLTNIQRGKSTTAVTSAPLSKFLSGGYSINVHIPDDPYTAVMCGDLPKR
jgi:hypothetical protein